MKNNEIIYTITASIFDKIDVKNGTEHFCTNYDGTMKNKKGDLIIINNRSFKIIDKIFKFSNEFQKHDFMDSTKSYFSIKIVYIVQDIFSTRLC